MCAYVCAYMPPNLAAYMRDLTALYSWCAVPEPAAEAARSIALLAYHRGEPWAELRAAIQHDLPVMAEMIPESIDPVDSIPLGFPLFACQPIVAIRNWRSKPKKQRPKRARK